MQYWLQPLAICVLYRVLIRAVRCLQGVEEGPGREGGPAMAFLFILAVVALKGEAKARGERPLPLRPGQAGARRIDRFR